MFRISGFQKCAVRESNTGRNKVTNNFSQDGDVQESCGHYILVVRVMYIYVFLAH